jgi:hypothetical protein
MVPMLGRREATRKAYFGVGMPNHHKILWMISESFGR